jgi:hypothetical protein
MRYRRCATVREMRTWPAGPSNLRFLELMMERFDDSDETGVYISDLLMQALNRQLRVQYPDHSPAVGALQNGHCLRLPQRNYTTALESVPFALRTRWNGHHEFSQLLFGYARRSSGCSDFRSVVNNEIDGHALVRSEVRTLYRRSRGSTGSAQISQDRESWAQ